MEQNKSLVLLEPKSQDLRKFNAARLQVKKALELVNAIVVTSQDQCDKALQDLKLARGVETLIEKKRKELVKPLNEKVSAINAYAKELAGEIPPAIEKGKKKIIEWEAAEKKKVTEDRTMERKNQLIFLGFVSNGVLFAHPANPTETDICVESIQTADNETWDTVLAQLVEKINTKINAAAEQKKSDSELDNFFSGNGAEDFLEVPEQLPLTIPISNGTAVSSPHVKGKTKRWTFEVDNDSLLPREYLMIDDSKITEAIRAGVRDIPGIRIFQQEGLMIR